MNQFTIKDIENLCGIKAHTLRIWEQRYQLFTPKRKESNHRYYDSEDLKHLLRISYLYHKGLKISKIALLKDDEIRMATFNTVSPVLDFEFHINQLTEASIDFDEERFEKSLQQICAAAGIQNAIVKVIYPYLERIGLLWMTDHVIPAQEHFSSSLINRKIILAIDALKNEKKALPRNVLLFAPEGEHHEIPLLYIHYLLKKNGDGIMYCGPNTSQNSLALITNERPVSHLYFHLITNLTRVDINEYVEVLSRRYLEKQIVISGPKVKDINRMDSNVRLLKSQEEINAFALSDE